MTVGRGIVMSCRTEDGDNLKGVASCGSLGGFDAVARPRLSKLNACPAAAGANGKLSVVFNLDFKTNHVGVEVGRSSTVAGSEGFASCLKTAFSAVSLGPIAHDQVKYALVYSAQFAPGPQPSTTPPSVGPAQPSGWPLPGRSAPASAPASVSSPADDGGAQVVWEVALVRDAPKTGQIVARLARGTKVRLGPAEDGWYKVQFGAGYTTDGYVYRGAIGK